MGNLFSGFNMGGPVGFLAGNLVGNALSGLLAKRRASARDVSDQWGGIENARLARLGALEQKALQPVRHAQRTAMETLAGATNSERRLRAAYREVIPQVYQALNQQIGEAYQRVYQSGLDYDLRMSQLRSDLATRLRQLDLQQQQIEQQRRAASLQMVGALIGGLFSRSGGSNNSS